jgi:hypothetical protein
MDERTDAAHGGFLSLVIPCYNEAAMVEQILMRVLASRYTGSRGATAPENRHSRTRGESPVAALLIGRHGGSAAAFA